MNVKEQKLLQKEIFENEIVTVAGRKYLENLLATVEVEDVFIGDSQAYSGYKVLVIAAKPQDIIGLKIFGRTEPYYPNINKLFFIECCLDDVEGFAIQVSNTGCEPVGYVDLD